MCLNSIILANSMIFILLTDNGFRDYYKPADMLFDACAAGRLLILSPWPYDSGKRHISRADCMALNAIAEEICNRCPAIDAPLSRNRYSIVSQSMLHCLAINASLSAS